MWLTVASPYLLVVLHQASNDSTVLEFAVCPALLEHPAAPDVLCMLYGPYTAVKLRQHSPCGVHPWWTMNCYTWLSITTLRVFDPSVSSAGSGSLRIGTGQMRNACNILHPGYALPEDRAAQTTQKCCFEASCCLPVTASANIAGTVNEKRSRRRDLARTLRDPLIAADMHGVLQYCESRVSCCKPLFLSAYKQQPSKPLSSSVVVEYINKRSSFYSHSL